MAITLVNNIGTSDPVLTLSAVPGAPFFKVDNEQFQVLAVPSPVRNERVSGNSGQGFDATVSVQVVRGFNGCDRSSHLAGATVTPLWEALTATAGTVV